MIDREQLLRIVYDRISNIINITENFIALKLHAEKSSDFEFLVGIILSQNTSDKNAIKAFENLKKLLGVITPENIMKHPVEDIAKAIRVAGLYNRRAMVLKNLAKMFIEKNIDNLCSMYRDADTLRRFLMEFPGIGMKTVDVFILMKCKGRTFPVDTHIRRVLSRLGISLKGDYEEIRGIAMNVFNDVDQLLKLHLLLIEFGRSICRARNPKCVECPLQDICEFYKNRIGLKSD